LIQLAENKLLTDTRPGIPHKNQPFLSQLYPKPPQMLKFNYKKLLSQDFSTP